MPLNTDLVPLSDTEFRYITGMLYDTFGIYLSGQKRILIAGRLSKRLRQLGFVSFTEYFEYLLADKSGAELSELINRITTNHSFFFREREHFDFLVKTVLPGLEGKIKQTARYPLRIWSAGCATGEEVYSISMLLREYYGNRIDTLDFGLFASDISLAALQEAGSGNYSETKLRELPAAFKKAYFVKTGEDVYSIADEIKKMVLFKRLNLMADSFPLKGQFDAVFCRNVMIYFDQESRRKVVQTLYNYVKPGGYFFIGHSESLRREDCPFAYIKPAVYRKGEL